jgi:hypothetical protein
VKAGRGGRTSPLSDDVEQSAKPRADRSVHFKRSGFVTVVEPSSPKVVALASTIACSTRMSAGTSAATFCASSEASFSGLVASPSALSPKVARLFSTVRVNWA